MTLHTDKHYEEELKLLKEEILKMGGLIEQMIVKAMNCLITRHSNLAEEIFAQDKEVDRLEMKIDDHCLKLLALHQPAASDLRFIAIGLKINKDLERIGDIAVNIGELARELNKEHQLNNFGVLPLLATKAQTMVKNALDAFVKQDPNEARAVCAMDDEADDLAHDVEENWLMKIQQDSTLTPTGIRVLLIARHLERVADHATNIAEEVVFMVQGKDIRHPSLGS